MAVLSEAPSLPPYMQDAAQQLNHLAAQNGKADGITMHDWTAVAHAGKALADNLRNESLRTAVGQTGLLQSIARLLEQAVRAEIGGAEVLSAQTELARVIGNLCFDHDANRQLVLDADVPLYLAQLLTRTLGVLPEGEMVECKQRVLSIDELIFIRATTGAFLNASLKFEPACRYLSRREILTPLLALLDARLSAGKCTESIYTVGCWSRANTAIQDVDERGERLQIGQTAARWAANVLEDVLSASKAEFPPTGVLSLASVVLSVAHLSTESHLPAHLDPEDANDFLDTDIELLTISSSLLESTAQDIPAAASVLAFSTLSPHLPYPNGTLLFRLLAFISYAACPPFWTQAATDDATRPEKAFGAIKAAVVRAVVAAPNNDEVMERLWVETKDNDESANGTSWLVNMMVRWLDEAQAEGREDKLVAAAHLLAGMGRRDEHTLSLVRDYGLAAPLAHIVTDRTSGAIGLTGRPGEITQVLFGVLSLLRHLAIPSANREIIGQTGVILPAAELLRRELDMVQPLQLAVVGLFKHLVTGNTSNALALCGLPSASVGATTPSPVDHLLALISRTDEMRLRSEGSRVIVNLARTLYSIPSSAASHEDVLSSLVAQGRATLLRRESVIAMSELVRRSEKFPILVNEGVVGLTLIAGSGKEGAALVLAAVLETPSRSAPPPPELHPLEGLSDSAPVAAISSAAAPQPPALSNTEPSSAAAMLARWLSLAPTLTENPAPAAALVRPEMLANAATLLHIVGRAAADAQDDAIEALRNMVQGPLDAASAVLDGPAGEVVRIAARSLARGD